MSGRVVSVTLDGLTGRAIEVEADVVGGLPGTVIVGLPDATVNEARDRCKSAVVNSGAPWPDQRITINLAPSTLPKSGSHYDLSTPRLGSTMNAAIYTRISKDRTGAGLGVDRQESDCRALAERLGWDVVEVYSDNDISAYSGKPRPGYRRMLEDIESGVIGGVVAWHSDRLHRRVSELEEFVTTCEKNSTEVQTVQSGSVDLSSASGRMVARMLGAAAQHEIDHSRERMKRAKEQAAASGKWRGGPRPFGYEADGVTVRPDEAGMVLAATREVSAGRSLSAIAREWNTAGTKGTRGQDWTPGRLRAVLLRPRNAGLVEVAGEAVGAAEWPAIVPEDVWRAVVGTLTDPRRRTNHSDGRVRWLGSGLFRCGVCDGPLRATKSKAVTTYRCPAGSHVSRSQAPVDELVLGTVMAYLDRPDVAVSLSEASRVDVKSEMDALGSLRRRLDGFEADYAAGDISGRQLREATERVNAEIEGIERSMAAKARGNVLAELAGEQGPSAAFERMPLDVKRAVLDMLLTVTIHPGSKGRPRGWRPGEPYTDLSTVEILWR